MTIIVKQEDGQAPVIKTEIDMNIIDFLYSDLANIKETLKDIQDVKLKYQEDEEIYTSEGLVESTLKETVNEAFNVVERLKDKLESEVAIDKSGNTSTEMLVDWFTTKGNA